MSDETTMKELIKFQYEIENLKRKIDENEVKLQRVDEILHNPDNGVYRRIAKSSETIEDQQKMLKALEQKVSNKFSTFEETLAELKKDMAVLNATDRAIKDISGENLSHIRLVVEKAKKSDKILWAIGTATIAGTVKILYDIIISILSAS